MRNLVPPLPTAHCEYCSGELLFERIEQDDQVLDIEVQVFVCAKCRRKYTRKLIHDPYTAHTLRGREKWSSQTETVEGCLACEAARSSTLCSKGTSEGRILG